MKTRNDRKLYYCLYMGREQKRDERGNRYGEKVPTYAAPVAMWANVSPASGTSQTEIFGGLESYDKVIVTKDMSCPIDENTVLFIDKEPEHNTDDALMYDYVVRRVARSLNVISIAVAKVTTS